ncbi:flagellar motor switch protein [Loktanella salsilacus]|jgi:hypothetical protein|uniref:flagellar motor switch protein n=2 Tax=Loktanella salsilacus TaxID=195913 RepID=UPI003001D722
MMSAVIDIVIMVLLVGTLTYAVILDRRMRKLMATLRDMEPMVTAFSNAVDQTTRSVEDMRDLSEAARHAVAAAQEVPKSTPKTIRTSTLTDQTPAQQRAARLRANEPVQWQTPVPGKSELVRTFFDITKERKK